MRAYRSGELFNPDGSMAMDAEDDQPVYLAADVAPLVRLVERLLPLFEDLTARWGRVAPRAEPDEITLTARFSVADLRAALEALRG